MSKNTKKDQKNTKGAQSSQTNHIESTGKQTKKNITFLINGEASLKFLLAKNPYDLSSHEKIVQKFANASLHLYNVKVFFPGILRSHQDILEFKYKILNEHHKAREPNSKKLCSESNTLLSLLLNKYGIETLFSDEMDVHSTLLQYALHDDAEKVLVYTKCQYQKLSKANVLFENKIKFFDKISYSQNGQLDFKSSIDFITGRYYTTEFKEPSLIDDKTLEFWKALISKSHNLPKCLTSYKEVKLTQIKENKNSILFASKAFVIHELGNPYLLLRKIRQAVYARLGIESIIEEVMEYNLSNNEYQFVPYLVKSDSTKEKDYLSKSPLQIKQLIFHNLDKTSNVLFTEFNNHSCSILAEICTLLSLVNQKEDIFLDLFKQYADKFKPVEKTILNKICYQCEKKFTMKESELEIYIIKELNYPSSCQNCIDERAQEKRIQEEMEKNLQTYMDEEDKKNLVEKEKEKEKEERVVGSRRKF
jgi:hypothetical protein